MKWKQLKVAKVNTTSDKVEIFFEQKEVAFVSPIPVISTLTKKQIHWGQKKL